jgi:hypothetical protein
MVHRNSDRTTCKQWEWWKGGTSSVSLDRNKDVGEGKKGVKCLGGNGFNE